MINDEFLNQLAHFTATRVGTEGGFCTNKGMRKMKQEIMKANLQPALVFCFICQGITIQITYSEIRISDKKLSFSRVANIIYARYQS